MTSLARSAPRLRTIISSASLYSRRRCCLPSSYSSTPRLYYWRAVDNRLIFNNSNYYAAAQGSFSDFKSQQQPIRVMTNTEDSNAVAIASSQDGTANETLNFNDSVDGSAACEGGTDAGGGADNSSSSSSSSNNNSNSSSSKQRKASRWKQLNEKKRSNKRKFIVDKNDAGGDWIKDKRPDVGGHGGNGGDEDDSEHQHHHQQQQHNKHDRRKSMYDNPYPNEGSFANKTMRTLFNIDLPEYENVVLTPNNNTNISTAAAAGDGEEVVVGKNENDIAVAAAATTTTIMTNNVDDSSMAAMIIPSIITENKVVVDDDDDGNNKVPKRKLAILISFLGTKYSGFQINGGQNTLQSNIELGLYKSGIISMRNFGYPTKYAWSNSARTDKGVHAAAQVCSFKGEMICHNTITTNTTVGDNNNDGDDEGSNNERKQLDAMRERINKHLPTDIRVLDIERVTRMFCARTNRDKVRYQYMVPSYLFCSEENVQKIFSNVKVVVDSSNAPTNTRADSVDVISNEDRVHVRTKLSTYRILPEQMDKLHDGLQMFEGTHCFHNYTRRLSANDASSTRYILSFNPLDPIIVDNTQWIPIQVVGQSFLLNQIRKMISAAVDYARGAVTKERIYQTLSKESRMKVNVAPAQGLFLDRSYFDLYNRHKIKNTPKKHKDDNQNTVPTLDWVEDDGIVEGQTLPNPAVRRIEEFKNEKIIPHIVSEEVKEGNFIQYMYSHHANFHEMYGLIGRVGDETRRGDCKEK